MNKVSKYKKFISSLKKLKTEQKIRLLYRGVDADFAFKRVGLDSQYNTPNQFSERLFFYGEKSKSFWNYNSISKTGLFKEITINNISNDFFKEIFYAFNYIYHKEKKKKGTIAFIFKNVEIFDFFKSFDNETDFLHKANALSDKKKTSIRNHYLVILHQLGESDYNKNSSFISSSSRRNIAQNFSKNDIIINFWDTNMSMSKTYLTLGTNLPHFKNKPYKNQSEFSLFTAIFPHYIYSYIFKGKTYINPAVLESTNFEKSIMTGLDIDQRNFEEKLKKETNYGHGVQRYKQDGEFVYVEIGKNDLDFT